MTSLSACKYIHHIHKCMCPQGSEALGGGVCTIFPSSGVTESSKLSCEYWDLNPCPQEQTVLLPADSSLRPSTPSIGIFIIIFPEIEKNTPEILIVLCDCPFWAQVWGGGGGACRAQGLTQTSSHQRTSGKHFCPLCFTLPTLLLFLDSYRWEAAYFMGERNLLTTQHTGLMLKILTNANNSIIKHNLMTLT